MMRREGIRWLSSTHKSIEEIATTILRAAIRPDRLILHAKLAVPATNRPPPRPHGPEQPRRAERAADRAERSGISALEKLIAIERSAIASPWRCAGVIWCSVA